MKIIIDATTGEMLYGTAVEVELQENEMAIDEVLTENYVKPYFNIETQSFYEGGTPEEIEEANKPIVPFEVALWRIRAILKLMGLEATIESALEQLPEPIKIGAKYIWQFGTVIERESQTVLMLQQVLGMTDQQLDDMFIQADGIII